jgi:3-carboxy-cis,cis-muconate cycloisomerase
VLSEQQTMTELTGRPAIPGYTGAAERLIDSTLQRARRYVKDAP